MRLYITPIKPDFVAEIGGIDARQKLDPSTLDEIVHALDRYPVIILRDQAMSQTEHVEFACQFGSIEDPLLKKALKSVFAEIEEANLHNLSNVDRSGKVVGRKDQAALVHFSNMMWHSDGSYDRYPKRYSMLFADTVPSWGANTEYADMRAAYDRLDERTKGAIADLTAVHDGRHKRDFVNLPAGVEFPPTRWPLVRTHPRTGRKVLFVGTFIREIDGMPGPEGAMLIEELVEHATEPEFVYSHKWHKGDLVIWDNRFLVHRGRRFDFTERRVMRRAATMDDVAGEVIQPSGREQVAV